MKIELGQKVKDTLTGVKGTVIGRTEYLYGCVRILIQPYGEKDGKAFEPFVVDEPQCEVVNAKRAKKAEPAHGPRPDAERRPDLR